MARGGKDGAAKVVLGDAVRDRRLLWAHCEACGHQSELDPAALAARLGYDFPIPDLRRRMRCSACQGRQVDVRVRYPSPGVVAQHRPREKEPGR